MRLSIGILTLLVALTVESFVPVTRGSFGAPALFAKKGRKGKKAKKLEPSTVVDLDGETPEIPDDPIEFIDIKDIPEYEYDENDHPIPHQPWRRGETNGCEDPIHAPWRREAEAIIKQAAYQAGGTVLDVTWYLTTCMITIDKNTSGVIQGIEGPPVLSTEGHWPMYRDPDNPDPEPIYLDEEPDYMWEKDVEAEWEMKRKSIAKKEDDDDDDVSIRAPPNYTTVHSRYIYIIGPLL